jgi:hypothetical protein
MNMNAAAILSITALLLCAGCDNPTPPPPTTSTATSEAAKAGSLGLPKGLLVQETVTDATGVGACKKSAKLGDTVTVIGYIGGSRKPFNASRAMFTIVDPTLAKCTEDHCETPWDYCCEPAESLRSNIAMVEIVDGDGKALPFSVKGASGLVPLASVAVTGTVVEQNDQGAFTVRASRISLQ